MSRAARKLFRRLTLSRVATHIYDRIYPIRSLGQRGERAAERFLLRQGMVIIARGFEDKFGEIDLIAVDDDTIVFAEVKTRSSDSSGSPAEAVDLAKQRHITRTATGFLKWHRLTDCRFRFDVIAVTWPDLAVPPKVVHYPNAFEPPGQFQMF